MADDSASSKGVSRGDTSGTKSSAGTGNTSGVGGGGGGGGGSTGSRGSSTGGVGAGNGSNAPGNKGGGGQGGQNSGAGRDSSRGLGQGAGGSAIGRGNTTGVGGPGGGGGMGGQNVRNGSSTSPVGPKSGSEAGGNIGGGTSRQAAGINDRMTGIQDQIDSSVSRGLNPNLGPNTQGIRDPQAARPYSAPPGASPVRDDRAPTVTRTPPTDVSRLANTFDLRGLTGPLGEPRVQPTTWGTNYQTAQMARDMYPDSIGKYDQARVTQAMEKWTGALPGEADINKYGDISNVMADLARVNLNQVIGGYSPEKASRALDTTGLRPATRGFDQPGPKSMGMTENWADPVLGEANKVRATQSLQDALFGRGVQPQAMNASNFVAAGTKMVDGVTPVGSPVNGTQYGNDTTWGTRIADRNERALNSINDRENLARDTTTPDVRPASESYDDRFRATASGSWTSPYDKPGASATPADLDGPQTYASVQGGLGMSPYNATPREDRLVTTGAPAKNFSGMDLSPTVRDDRYYGGSWKTEQPDDGTWGDRDDRDPLGNWYSGQTPAADGERILDVEDVPPEYISPTTQMPPPQLPEKTWPEKILEKAPYLGPGMKFMRGITSWEYDRLDEQGRADLMEKWANNKATYGKTEGLGGSHNEPQNPLDLYGGGNNAYIPKGTGAPPPPDDDEEPKDTLAQRMRNPNPLDPYNYGYGPAHEYFYYA
jgi:hypothetical protein